MRSWKSFAPSFATLGARLTSTIGLMITNSVASRRMTGEQFGFWVILLSLNLLTNGFDLGFQFTLGNRLAALGSRGVDGEEERRETYLSIIFLQLALYVAYSALALIIVPLIPWAHWFKIKDPLLAAHIAHFMPVVLIVMMGTLPVGLVWTVFFAYHEIKLASALTVLSNLLQTIVFIVAAYALDLPSLRAFSSVVLIYFAFFLLQGLVVTAYVFIRRGWRFSILPAGRIIAIIRSMARVSFHAFFQTITSIISGILGTIISGLGFGLVVAGDFNWIQRLFSFLGAAHLSILSPIAPAVTRESHAGDWDSVRRRLRRCVAVVWPGFFLLAGVSVWLAHPVVLGVLAGHPIRDYPLAGLLLLAACMGGFINTYSVFLNSLGLVKMQASVSFVMMVPSLILPILLSRWLGVLGIALAALLCTIPGVIIWPLYTRRALRLKLLRV
jgi:O-antigen/teichoic acid export membrane protein